MNGKKKFDFTEIVFGAFVLVAVGLALLLCLALGGCASTGGQKGDLIGTVERNSRDFGRLEAAIDALDDATERGRARISETIRNSQNIEDSISRIVYLFGEYEQIAFGLLDEIDRIRNEVKAQGEDNNVVHDSASGGGGGSDSFVDSGGQVSH